MTSRTTLLDLARRVGEATGRDRELDAWIWNHLGHTEGDDAEIAWRKHLPMGPKEIVQGQTMAAAIEQFPNDLAGIARSWNVPPLTASIDAALALVEKTIGSAYWPAIVHKALSALSEKHYWPVTPFSSHEQLREFPIAILAALIAAKLEDTP